MIAQELVRNAPLINGGGTNIDMRTGIHDS
jgi:hypothetical protein